MPITDNARKPESQLLHSAHFTILDGQNFSVVVIYVNYLEGPRPRPSLRLKRIISLLKQASGLIIPRPGKSYGDFPAVPAFVELNLFKTDVRNLLFNENIRYVVFR